MMLSLGIAEDELIEQEALAYFVHQNFPDIQILWRASDGRQALSFLRQSPPDILLLDINMPLLSGIDLMRNLWEEQYRGVILINTAYDSFDYAKQAVQYNAFDYIVKPSSEQEMRTAFEKAIAEVRRRKRLLDDVMQLKRDADIAKRYTGIFVMHVLESGEDAHDMLAMLGWPQEPFQTLVITLLGDLADWTWPSALNHLGVRFVSNQRSSGCVTLLSQPDTPLSQARFQALLHGIFKEYERAFPGVEAVCVSDCCRTSSQIARALVQQRNPTPCADPFKTQALAPKERQHLLTSFMRHLQDRHPKRAIELFTSCWNKYDDEKERLDLLLTVLDSLVSFAPDFSLLPILRPLAHGQDPLSAVHQALMQARNERYADAMDLAYHIMCEQLGQNLTQEQVASSLGLSPSYFSRLFKQRTGKKFIDVLTELRVQRATDMLTENPNCSLSELHVACGLTSKAYFCEVFKRCTGMTVTQYQDYLKAK